MTISPDYRRSQLDSRSVLAAARAIDAEVRRRRYNALNALYPAAGPLARELYAPHLAFFAAGAQYRERLMLAANRVGKTYGVGGYELTLHLTGNYPAWWQGRRFFRPISAWAAGDTAKTVRDILQKALLGDSGDFGSGLIPAVNIVSTRAKMGVGDAVEIIQVSHAAGGRSTLTLKSYDQGRRAFQGTAQDVIWLDEEPPLDVYQECLMRTMTTDGLILLTFTPLQGMSEVVLTFLQDETHRRYRVSCTWDDVPHLSDVVKKELWDALPPHQRDARAKGLPQLGAGAIYPVSESDVVCDPFEIPSHFRRVYGLDVGWNRTAAIWGAIDPADSTIYLYSEHYVGAVEPATHAVAIKARGEWIQGVIDPAAGGRSQHDGKSLLDLYRAMGLNLHAANNAVESGLYAVWQHLAAGRLKVFSTCKNWLQEFRLYRRDDKGRVVKENDHLMDAMRYLVVSGIEHAKTEEKRKQPPRYFSGGSGQGWMS